MLNIRSEITAASLNDKLTKLWDLAETKIHDLQKASELGGATPVFTANGLYQPQGWTEWTQGFQYGCQILQFDATGDETFLEMGRQNTLERMAAP